MTVNCNPKDGAIGQIRGIRDGAACTSSDSDHLMET
jgi:hypothetical protein